MNELLPNTDNFFKYLLTIGLLLILFTVLYPIQKQKEVDLEILNQTLSCKILEHKIESFKTEQENLNSQQKTIQEKLNHLKDIKTKYSQRGKDSLETIRIHIKEDFDSEKERLLSIGDSLKIGNIALEINERRIERLNSYFSIFKTYKLLFLILGLLMTFFGFRYWLSSVYIDELKKGEEMATPFRPSFVRHVDYCMLLLKKRGIAVLAILLFIMLLLIIYFFA